MPLPLLSIDSATVVNHLPPGRVRGFMFYNSSMLQYFVLKVCARRLDISVAKWVKSTKSSENYCNVRPI